MTIAAPTQPDQQQRPEPARDLRIHRHPLDQSIPDPSGLTPLGDEPEFAAILESTVAEHCKPELKE